MKQILKIYAKRVVAKCMVRITPYILTWNFLYIRFLQSGFFKSQSSCSHLTWMFYLETLNNKINTVLEKCLHLICNDKLPTFHGLPYKEKYVCMRSHIDTRFIGIFINIFLITENKVNYNLRHFSNFVMLLGNLLTFKLKPWIFLTQKY